MLHVRQGTHIWGPERQIIQLTAGLPAFGFIVDTVAFHRDLKQCTPPLVQALQSVGSRAETVNASWSNLPSTIRHLTGRMRTGGYCLAHTHEYKTHLIGGLAARRAGVLWIASDHGLFTGASLSLKLYRTMEEIALRKASRVIVPSPFQRDRLQARGVPLERITVIQHGIDISHFAGTAKSSRPSIRQALDTAPDAPVLLAVGRLEPVKGHRFLIEAVHQIRRTCPKADVWLAGEGSSRADLERLAAKLGILDAVKFLGYRSDVADLMLASDIVVMPSLVETFGIAVIEALALARPVIASNVGAIQETIKEGETGWLVSPASPQALAQTVQDMLESGDEMKRRGQNGRALVKMRFNVGIMIERVKQLYSEVLACQFQVS